MSHKHKHEQEDPAGSGAPNGQPASPAPADAPGTAPAPGAATGANAPNANPAPAASDAIALQAERDDLLRRLQHLSADYLNYQKRIQKEVRLSREFANEELLKAILPVLDDVEKALEAGAANYPADDPLLVGLRLIQQKALAALGPFGLSPVECLGKPFDPDRHSAVVQEPTADHPPNTVVRELRKGYTIQGRTIRPAMVVVSVAPKPV